MERTPDDKDRKWDSLLRRAGPDLELPAEPDPQRRQSWKQPRVPRPPRRRLRYTLWGGSGAVAAAIALSFMLLLNPRPVDAGVIFANLRQALDRCMRVSFENVEIDLARLRPDLRGYLRCSGSVVAADRARSRAFADVDVSLAARTRDTRIPQMDLRLKTAAVPQAEWAYVQLERCGPWESGIDPRLAMLADLVRRGVYVDLAGLLDSQAGRRVSALPAVGLEAVLELRDREGLAALFELVERHAGDTRVRPHPDGGYVLTARGFRIVEDRAVGRPGLGQVLAGLLADMELEVLYDEDAGVRRLVIDHVGHADGRVTLDLVGVVFDEELTNMTGHRRERPGMVLDLRSVRRLGKWGMVSG